MARRRKLRPVRPAYAFATRRSGGGDADAEALSVDLPIGFENRRGLCGLLRRLSARREGIAYTVRIVE